MDKTIQEFKGRFNERLDSLGITQAEVARRTGEPPQTISNWLKRGSVPAGKLFKLCDVLECDSKWLLSGSGPVNIPSEPAHDRRPGADVKVNVADTIAKLLQLPEGALADVDRIIDRINKG